MKYKIGYFICELKENAMGELEPVIVSDFIPLDPPAIFENKEEAIIKVDELKLQEQTKARITNSFNAVGDRLNNYCYNEIDYGLNDIARATAEYVYKSKK